MQIFDRTKIMLFVIIFPGGCTEFPEISRFLATLSVQLPAVLLSHSNTRQRIHATASVHQPVEICGWLRSEAGKVTTGPAESNGSLLPGARLTLSCGLTACKLGSALGPTVGIEYGKPLPFFTFTLLVGCQE